MAREDNIEIEGKVIDLLPSGKFLVEWSDDNETQTIAHLSGQMRKNKIRVVLGDIVKVHVSPYDTSRGILTYRKY